MSETGTRPTLPMRLSEYRDQARTWLAANTNRLERRADGSLVTDRSDPDDAQMARARQMQGKLFTAGYAGITFPKEFGGQGLTLDHERVFLEEAARYDIPTEIFGVSINILGATLLEYGTPDQKTKHLPKILCGEEIWLQFLSEPSAGSDLAALISRADRDGQGFVLNGQKIWSTGGQHSDFAICLARTRWDVPKHDGISAFIVDLRAPGVEIRRIKQIDGNAEFCEEFFTDVVIPAADLIGTENDGWRVARGLLRIEHEWVGRSGFGGGPQRGIEDLLALAERRGLSGDQGVRRAIAAFYAADRVYRLTSARISNAIATDKMPSGYGGVLKLGTANLQQRRAELALSL
jgi:alkylation response protein AidB-like acyl-CoA dehydrogenase